MRVALFTEVFLPKVDGIVNTLRYLLDHLATRGHPSLLFAPHEAPARYAHTPVIGLPGLAFPLYPDLKLVPPTIDVSTQLEAFRPDLVHIVNPVSLGLAGLWHARKLGVPVVASYHTDAPGFAERWGLGIFRDPLWAFFRWLHNQADLNLCPSSWTKAELEAQGFERLGIWGRGVDTARFHPMRRSHDWRLRLTGGRPDAPLLLYVGRLSPEKRVEWLRPVLDAAPDACLAIVGDGPARVTLEKTFADTPTVFTGFLSGLDLAQAYAAADVFTFPAANETLGNVVLEAMASGLPVIAPRSGGLLDHVVDQKTGILVDASQPTEYVQAACALIGDLDYARRLGMYGRTQVENRTWAATLDGLLDQYQTLIGQTALKQAA